MSAASRRTALLFGLLFVAATRLQLPVADAQPPDAVRQLFDGESLSGWDGDREHWRVEKGAIVGEIPEGQTLRKNTWLVWRDGELKDFDLRLQVKLTGAPAANSGIQFRCQVESVDHVSGYQADLDMGTTWLGRIYDEHGRALLVERGTRVRIAADGMRTVETFAPADQYAVLFRENDWNDYRIVAVGDHVAVYVNGTLFSELQDQQTGERDLSGQLALQLHSGPTTRVEFRNIQLETLAPNDDRLPPISIRDPGPPTDDEISGVSPKTADGRTLNLSFESGDLTDWTATGNAFDSQPVSSDGIAQRWPGQVSNKHGRFFIGGYEVVQDGGQGSLTSVAFPVTHPWASFLIGGGNSEATRVDIVQIDADTARETTLASAVGDNREQMRRVVVDLRPHAGSRIAVRLIDDSRGGWGHLNFDDFRFHRERPAFAEPQAVWRSTHNPLLQHLVPNPAVADDSPAAATVRQMFVPQGFSVDVIAAEPDLHQPMAFAFDARGRLWVVEGHSYPQKRPAGAGLDRVLIFADDDADGSFETRNVFVEGLNLVSGLEIGFGGVWIGAAPELLFIPDRNQDDVPDGPPQVLLDGFGFADTHETLNSFLWGPDGWLYGNQGVFNSSLIGKPGAADTDRTQLSAGVWRYHPVRHEFEVYAHGGSNQWGLDYDEHGQMFMTHCRSYWGRGLTTHVVRGGHYWNQVNSGYAPFVSSQAPDGIPELRNFLLASARYGHGEGGAGKPGSRLVYGGHSHVGTMIYLGDNWPAEYRNHLFTHNLHGHQINHQVNLREAGGFHTVHAGSDVLFCGDQQYIGVDLQFGPDGAVYISDWYDPRHCHNPDVEQWDRGNGRMYRMKYDATWKPVAVDYEHATDDELVAALLHPNDWHARTAHRVLQERAADRRIADSVISSLKNLAVNHTAVNRRLHGLWTLHCIDALDQSTIDLLLQDEDEYVRGWVVLLITDKAIGSDKQAEAMTEQLLRVVNDKSLFVRRCLASAIQRVPPATGWNLAETLSRQPENTVDRDLPGMIWFGLAMLMPQDLNRSFAFAEDTAIPQLRNWIHWYAARSSSEGRAALVQQLAAFDAHEQQRLLTLLEFAVRGMRGLPQPDAWSGVAARYYVEGDPRMRDTAESVGAAFGDKQLYARMRDVIARESSSSRDVRHALSILDSDASDENVRHLLRLLDSTEFAATALPQLARHNDDAIAAAVLSRLPQWQDQTYAAAMELLSGRVAWANALLDAIARGHVDKSRLTAYYARQMASLGNPALNARIETEWGALGQSSEERRHQIHRFIADYQSAPLWAYDAGAGAAHFRKLCASCHEPTPQNAAIAPKLAGSGSKGIGYLVENVLDPNAVIGRDFQARVIVTSSGQVVVGLVESETDTALTVRTATNTVVIARDEIDEMRISRNSFMPEELLKTLNEREQIELFKYLMSL